MSQQNTTYTQMPGVVRPGAPANYDLKKVMTLAETDGLGITGAQVLDGVKQVLAKKYKMDDLFTNMLFELQQMSAKTQVAKKGGAKDEDFSTCAYGMSENRNKIRGLRNGAMPPSKKLTHHEYDYALETPNEIRYKVVVAPVAVGGRVGLGGTHFSFIMQGGSVSPEEQYLLGDLETTIFIQNVSDATAFPGAYRVEAFITNGKEYPNKYINPTRLAVGAELMRISNNKAYTSTFGSTISMTFPAWAKGYVGFSRWQFGKDISAHYGTGKNYYTAYPTKGTYAGQELVFSIDNMKEATIYQATLEQDRQMFYGKRMRDENGGFLRDPRGGEYITEDGILAQADPRMHLTYSRMNIQIFDWILEKASLSSPGCIPTVLVYCGDWFMQQFSKMIADVYKYDPKVMYFDRNEGTSFIDIGRGINTAFNAYTSPMGNIILKKCPYLCAPNSLPGQILPNGVNEASAKAYFINVTANDNDGGGLSNLSAFEFIPYLETEINGVGFGAVGSHSRLQSETHLVMGKSVRLHNPTAFGTISMAV